MEHVEYFNLNKLIVSSDLLDKGEFRLNSDYYEAMHISRKFHKSATILLKEIASVSHPGITKRTYIDNPKFGIPFLSTSDIQFYEAIDKKYVSKEASKNLSDYIVNEDMILISRSGTIGIIAMVDKNMRGYAVTEHAIRVELNDKEYFGLVYTYLNSEIGQKIIKGQKSGAVIDEIYDADIEQIEIPVIEKQVILSINEKIIKVKQYREIAFDLINKASSLTLKYNNLPVITGGENGSLDHYKNEVEIQLTKTTEFTNDYRLDAHFYNSMADLAVNNIRKYTKDYRKLNENIADKLFYLNRFARTFVTKDYGIPYLAGKDIIKIRPTDVSYLSQSETYGLEDYKLTKGWILMTCSGTLGRTCLIWNNYENWVGTHDLIRIVCNENFDSGYLYAFLSSDYGYYQAIRYKHGSVIDHLTPEQIEEIIIPLPSKNEMKEIGDLVRKAYDLRAEAIKLEDEAQEILTKALTIN